MNAESPLPASIESLDQYVMQNITRFLVRDSRDIASVRATCTTLANFISAKSIPPMSAYTIFARIMKDECTSPEDLVRALDNTNITRILYNKFSRFDSITLCTRILCEKSMAHLRAIAPYTNANNDFIYDMIFAYFRYGCTKDAGADMVATARIYNLSDECVIVTTELCEIIEKLSLLDETEENLSFSVSLKRYIIWLDYSHHNSIGSNKYKGIVSALLFKHIFPNVVCNEDMNVYINNLSLDSLVFACTDAHIMMNYIRINEPISFTVMFENIAQLSNDMSFWYTLRELVGANTLNKYSARNVHRIIMQSTRVVCAEWRAFWHKVFIEDNAIALVVNDYVMSIIICSCSVAEIEETFKKGIPLIRRDATCALVTFNKDAFIWICEHAMFDNETYVIMFENIIKMYTIMLLADADPCEYMRAIFNISPIHISARIQCLLDGEIEIDYGIRYQFVIQSLRNFMQSLLQKKKIISHL